MPRWIGLLGSWALLVLGLGLTTFAAAAEWINIREDQRFRRLATIDEMIAERTGRKADQLRATAERRATHLETLKTKITDVTAKTEDIPDTDQIITISTAENKLYVRRNGQVIFEAICSTGKGTRLAVDGKTLVFNTPIGKLRVISKEENPVWVPPDWHYIEQARKAGMRVVRLNRGSSVSLGGGSSSGFWSWFGGGSSGPVLRVRGNDVVKDYGDYEQPLPPGEMIYAGGAVVIPPIGTRQRQFDKVLGRYRLNLGDGYAIHGTQETSKLGQSVSHGCVRLGDDDIERLHAMANVGDEVIIY